MSQSSSTFSVFLPVDLHQPRQDQSTEVQVGKKKVLNVKIHFPKNPSLETTLPRGRRGYMLGRGGEGSVWETEVREGAVASPVEGAAGPGSPPPPPSPWAEAPGGPRVPSGAEEVM